MSDQITLLHHMRLLSVLAACLLSGCVMGPDFTPPDPHLPRIWQNDDQSRNTKSADQCWWKSFNDPTLNSLMVQAGQGNPDIAMSLERIRAARLQRGAVSAEGMPTLDGQAGFSRERLATAGVGQVLQSLLGLESRQFGSEPEGVAYSNYSIGGVASWELDLWGRQRRMREAAKAEYSAVQADADALRLSVESEIARTYFQWRNTRDDLARAEKNLETNNTLLSIAQTVRQHGLLASVDLDDRLTAQNTALVEKDALIARLGSLHRALATLVAGRPDADLPALAFSAPVQDLVIPETVAGVPSEIARNRPDIRAAEARLHTATALIGVAKADFYPKLMLTGQFTLDALTVAELGWNARNTSFGPSLTLPIFNGGRLSRQLELRQSAARSAGIAYQIAVLNAWKEIEDLLANRRFLRQKYESLLTVNNERKERIVALTDRYRHGDIARTDLLMAILSGDETRTDLDHTRTALLVNEVNLNAALGRSS
ncbi:efflux transporter outer membrane subunit [Acetobacter sicerae]|uniref:Efflux transporter outer membrane subunit n=1 Tax=Acetobacter sicerae TaxID=85325 RepID=A0ABS8W000_9PROT|nr:efflux transporter outer membrane subunit [Acetobacter sicerae]MCE0744800.1 efflux transporter outer membrane subunit [Acetobacter sicerae]